MCTFVTLVLYMLSDIHSTVRCDSQSTVKGIYTLFSYVFETLVCMTLNSISPRTQDDLNYTRRSKGELAYPWQQIKYGHPLIRFV